MHKDQFNKEIERFKQKSVSENRKEYIKSEVFRHAHNNPEQVAVRQFFAKKVVIISLLLAVLFGGTAFAAEQSLPGDTLYPIKVLVLEPIVKATKLSVEAKSDYEMILSEKRAEEQRLLSERKEKKNVRVDEASGQEMTIEGRATFETSTISENTDMEDSASLEINVEVDASNTSSTESIDEFIPLLEQSIIDVETEGKFEIGADALELPAKADPELTPLPSSSIPDIKLPL